MNKKVLLVILSILSILLFGNVNAATQYTSFTASVGARKTFEIGTGIEDNEFRIYKSGPFPIIVGDKEYTGYCIDPGLGKPETVTCELMDPESYPMVYMAILDSNSRGATINDIVFRTLGGMERNTLSYTISGTNEKFRRNPSNVALTATWHQALVDAGIMPADSIDPVNIPYIPSTPEWVTARAAIASYAKYWTGGPNPVTPSISSSSSSSLNTTSSTTGKYFKLTKLGKNANGQTRYKIETISGGKATDVDIKPAKGTVVNIESPWNGTSAIIAISVSSKTCKGKITVTGVIADNTLMTTSSGDTPYLCVGNGNTQSYVVLMPGPAGDIFDSLEVDDCDNDCVEKKRLPPEKKTSHAQPKNNLDPDYVVKESQDKKGASSGGPTLCCLGGPSEWSGGNEVKIREYKIDELFESSENEYLKVVNYTNKCDNDYYKDPEMQTELESGFDYKGTSEQISSYCNVYCTESLDVTVPGSILSATGKYFKLPEISVHGKTGHAPIIYGEKSCRLKVDIRTLRSHYEKAINGNVTDPENEVTANDGEVHWYNEFQKEKSFELLLESPTKEDGTFNQTIDSWTVSKTTCTKLLEGDAKPGNGATCSPKNDSGGCSTGSGDVCKCTTANCTCDSCYVEEKDTKTISSFSCKTSYDVYTLTPNSDIDYYTSGSGTDTKYKVDYYYVKSNSKFKFSEKEWPGLKIKKKDSVEGTNSYYKYNYYNWKTECSDAINNADSSYRSSGYTRDSEPTYESLQSAHNGYHNNNVPGDYATHQSAASTANTNYQTNKTLATVIENIYDRCQGYMESATNTYSLNVSADFHYLQVYLNGNRNKQPKENTIPAGPATCDKSESSISTKSSGLINKNESMKDIGLDGLSEVLGDDDEVPSDDEATFKSQVIYDRSYTTTCQIPDPSLDGEITVYPDLRQEWGTSISRDDLRTAHGLQYSIYLTSYSGQFETWWDIRNLGSKRTKSKFTTYFNTEQTCAEGDYVTSGGTAENLKKRANVVPFTCNLQIKDGGMRIGHCNPGVSSNYNCTTNEVNEVYEFRVVDPKNMFPANSKYWQDNMAKNWKNSSGGFGKTYDAIRKVAQKDKTYSPDNLTYSFKLDSNALKKIKKYNSGKQYTDFDLTCECPDSVDNQNCGIIPESSTGSCKSSSTVWTYTCRKCKSAFLTAISDNFATIPGNGHLDYKVWNNPNKSLAEIRNNDNKFTGVGAHWA